MTLHNLPTTIRRTMSRKRTRQTIALHCTCCFLVASWVQQVSAFAPMSASGTMHRAVFRVPQRLSTAPSSSAVSAWWFGSSPEAIDMSGSAESGDAAEPVPITIERPTSGSRKIFGEIKAPVPLEDVWSILTDYDRLAMHVPNLKESRTVAQTGPGEPGDGTYQFRLFQRGAQRIVGFEFGASVTMDMKERIVSDAERHISFKCADSFFFSAFDGEWILKQLRNPATGEEETLLSYFVTVKPKGPVPVAALEWRIREDVPTNLRAVKHASLKVQGRKEDPPVSSSSTVLADSSQTRKGAAARSMLATMRKVKWQKDETMAAYLTDKP